MTRSGNRSEDRNEHEVTGPPRVDRGKARGKGKMMAAALLSAFLIAAAMIMLDEPLLGIASGSSIVMLLLIYLMYSSIRSIRR